MEKTPGIWFFVLLGGFGLWLLYGFVQGSLSKRSWARAEPERRREASARADAAFAQAFVLREGMSPEARLRLGVDAFLGSYKASYQSTDDDLRARVRHAAKEVGVPEPEFGAAVTAVKIGMYLRARQQFRDGVGLPKPRAGTSALGRANDFHAFQTARQNQHGELSSMAAETTKFVRLYADDELRALASEGGL